MAKRFTGGANTTMLNRTLASGIGGLATFAVGCWIKINTAATGRIIVGAGTTPASAFSGMMTGASTATRLALRVDFATSDVVCEINSLGTGIWQCLVFNFVSGTGSANTLWQGSLSAPMALATHVSDASNIGSGNSSTAGVIGKSSAASSAIDADISHAFIIGGNMRDFDIELYRKGDMFNSVLRYQPKAFVPMKHGQEGLLDMGNESPIKWTATGSPATSEDPPIAFTYGPIQATRVLRVPG